MAEVRILIEGYAKEVDGMEYACSSVTLVRAGQSNILVDTGSNRELLLEALRKEDLRPSDIGIVVLTHTHLDHCMLVGIFENAVILDGDSVYSFDGRISGHDGMVPDTDLEIVPTPGHDQFHCAVLVNTAEYGRVAISADVFWWVDAEEQRTDETSLLEREDPYVKDADALLASRKMILERADYIVPGHGKPFFVRKSE
ncbi:MAG TPA: MBL fold metallo-hydrolase [Candidatus Fimivivens sp.]|nr:MBL fold metallo-hydrolase [Candidatus Fimivivens sp.]